MRLFAIACILLVQPVFAVAQGESSKAEVTGFAGMTWGQDTTSAAAKYAKSSSLSYPSRREIAGVVDGVVYKTDGEFLEVNGDLSFGFCAGGFCYGEFEPFMNRISPMDATRIINAIESKYGVPTEFKVDGKVAPYVGAGVVVKEGSIVVQNGVGLHSIQQISWRTTSGDIEIDIGSTGMENNTGWVNITVRYLSAKWIRERASSTKSEY